jgi:hypothetical protein
MRLNVTIPDELGTRAKAADLKFSALLRAAVEDELIWVEPAEIPEAEPQKPEPEKPDPDPDPEPWIEDRVVIPRPPVTRRVRLRLKLRKCRKRLISQKYHRPPSRFERWCQRVTNAVLLVTILALLIPAGADPATSLHPGHHRAPQARSGPFHSRR